MTNLELAKEQGKQAAPNVIDAAKTGEIRTDISLAEQQGNQAGLLLAENFKGTELYERMKEQGNRAIPLIVDGFISGAGDIPVTEGWQLRILSAFTSGNYTPGYTQRTFEAPYYIEITAYALMQRGYKLPDLSLGTFTVVPWHGYSSPWNKHMSLVPRPEDETIMPEVDVTFYSVETSKLQTQEALLAARSAFKTEGIQLNDSICYFTFLFASNTALPDDTDRLQFLYHTNFNPDDNWFYTYLFEGSAMLNATPIDRGIIPDITEHGHLKYYSQWSSESNPAGGHSTHNLALILTDGQLQTNVYGQFNLDAIYFECDTLPQARVSQVVPPISQYCDADLLEWITTQTSGNNKHAYLLLIYNEDQVYTGTHDVIIKAMTSKGIEAGTAPLIFV